ncbi:transposase [Primorskyibacter flagellatus]|uniref:Transposase n=1 Tax=Primorskyibacter flagellatus TaxID=1387277 RepID=A0A917EKI6_9RHOB|nr:DDE-type integrase/transposase/recombinase [Primorskyibacter flagellatus]GGE47883.1 transposase [Primorskyibacter flagellatus]
MTVVQKVDGRHLRLDGEIYRVIGRVSGRPAVCIELGGHQSEITLEEFHDAISRGDVSDGQEPEFEGRVLGPEEKVEAAYRKRLLELVETFQSEGMKWPEVIEQAQKQLKLDERFATYAANMPSVRAIQTLRKRVHLKGHIGLVDGRSANSGNFDRRHDDLFEEIVLDIIEEHFLRSDAVTLTFVANTARAKYAKEFVGKESEAKACGRKSVEAIIRDYVVHEDALKSRMGAKAARPLLRQAGRFQKIDYAFDRLEIDSTQADIFVVYEGNLVRPWVTIVVDAATGFIVGLVVSLAPPTGASTVAALFEAMTGPDNAFFDLHGIQNRVRVKGNPLTVVADQGSENGGDIIKRLLEVTGVELQKNTPGHPEKKPFVERAMRTLKTYVTQLDGTTQTQLMPAQTRTAKAINEACLTFEEFATMLQRWRFDIYGRLPRRSVQSPLRRSESPTESWKRLLTLAHVPEPLSRNELIQMFYCIREKRCLFHYGIEVGRVQYWSWDLAQIHRNNPNTVQLEVWTNPGDIRTVIVVHPDTGKAITVPCKDPEMPPLTSAERDRILAANRRKPEDYFSAHEALAALVGGLHHAPRKKKSKMAKAGEEARRVHRDKEIVRKSSTRVVQDKPIEPAVAMLPVQIPTKRNKITMRG